MLMIWLRKPKPRCGRCERARLPHGVLDLGGAGVVFRCHALLPALRRQRCQRTLLVPLRCWIWT